MGKAEWNDDLINNEVWKDIPIDTKFRYQASNIGRICHVYDNGKRRILNECYVKTLHGWVTGVTMSDGTYRKFQTISLVARTWLGTHDSSWQAIHKNGVLSDHRIENIKYVKRSEIGKIASVKKRKSVFKINSDGEVVEIYKSARECADKNHFCYASIKRRCNGDFKNPIASDGYAYVYEDKTAKYNKLIRELERLRIGDTPKIVQRTSNYDYDF